MHPSTLSSSTCIIWFRRDLRLEDNSALYAACQTALEQKKQLLGIVVKEENAFCPKQSHLNLNWAYPEAASSYVWWCENLHLFQKALKNLHIPLIYIPHSIEKALGILETELNVEHFFYNAHAEPHLVEQDQKTLKSLKQSDREVHLFSPNLLFNPGDIVKNNREPYLIFTAFWKRCLEVVETPAPLPAPPPLPEQNMKLLSQKLQQYTQLPQSQNTRGTFYTEPGEINAHRNLDQFLTSRLATYEEMRNFPKLTATSQLSAHLHFGSITPRAIFYKARSFPHASDFLREIGWREFAYHTLHFFPQLPFGSLYKQMLNFSYRHDPKDLEAWKTGQTGYPIVDAGMRELKLLGTMHNRVRMITASFLTKHLLIAWQEGAIWFWEQLFDADLAVNSLNWQWVAGSGIDPQPFFRIFNPILQGKKFDIDGSYVRKFIPELAQLPAAYIHTPWTADALTLSRAGVVLGKTYPFPLVDHQQATKRALAAYDKAKS